MVFSAHFFFSFSSILPLPFATDSGSNPPPPRQADEGDKPFPLLNQ
jgi:hypothetical protein